MHWNRWKLFYVSSLLVGILLLPAFFSKGCGWGYDYEDLNFSFYYEKKVFSTNPYQVFNFSEHLIYDHLTSDRNELNISDWQSYFGKKWERDSIKKLIYTTTTGMLDSALMRVTQPNSTYKIPLVLEQVVQRKDVDFMHYLKFAKWCEPHANFEPSYWDDEERDFKAMDSLIQIGYKALSQCNTLFIKKRYIYQLIRLYHYSSQYEQCIQTYDSLIGPRVIDKDLMYYWSLSLKAGAYRNLDKNVEASYLFSKVFASNTGRSVQAKRGFKLENQEEWDACQIHCKNNQERADLWFLKGLGYYERALPSCKAILRFYPDEDKMLHLIGRDIARMEDGMFANKRGGGSYYGFEYEKEYINELIQFIENEVLANRTLQRKNEWTFTIGYLYFLTQEHNSAERYFLLTEENIEKARNKNEDLLGQIAGMKMLLKYTEGIDREKEDELIDDLLTLSKNRFVPNDFYQYLLDLMVEEYQKDQDPALGAFLTDLDEYTYVFMGGNPHKWDLEGIERLIKKEEKSKLEEFLVSQYSYSIGDIYYLKALVALEQDSLKQVVEYLTTSEKSGLKKIYPTQLMADIYGYRIRDCHDCDYQDFKGAELTLKQVVEVLLDLKSQLKSPELQPEEKAKIALKLGNMYYNLTRYGNAWYLADLTFGGALFRASTEQMEADDISIADCTPAYRYYKLAKAWSTDTEEQALLTFLMAKCEQNDFYFDLNINGDSYYYGGYDDDEDLSYKEERYRTHFDTLIQTYSNTKFFARALEECGYLGTYQKKYFGEKD